MTDKRKSAEQVEAERVYLLAFGADIDDTGQWTVNGEPATPWQLRQIRRATPRSWEDALTLIALDRDHAGDVVEQQQRAQIRQANGLDGPDDRDAA